MAIKPNWTLRNLYLYLVCFVTVIMILIGAVSTVNNLIDLAYEVPPYVESKEDMLKNFENLSEKGVFADMTFEEYKDMRSEDIEMQKERDRVYDLRSLFHSMSIFIIGIPFYIYHWRKIEKQISPS